MALSSGLEEKPYSCVICNGKWSRDNNQLQSTKITQCIWIGVWKCFKQIKVMKITDKNVGYEQGRYLGAGGNE